MPSTKHSITPIEPGRLCAVDEFGFYIMSDDQVAAPAVRPMEHEHERHEAFWVLAISQHIAINKAALARMEDGGEDTNNVLKSPSRVLSSPPVEETSTMSLDPSEAASVSLQRNMVHESPELQSRQQQSATDRVAAGLMRRMRKRMRRYGGLPQPRLRRIVWPFLSGASRRTGTSMSPLARSMHYNQLIHTPIDPELQDVILRDLGRTFPTHCLFKDASSVGQETLHRILTAYCAFDPEVGYCQGMGFIVAVLTLHLAEEEAFWVFVQLMHGKQFAMRQLYLPGFPLLQQFFVIFRQLSKRLMPRLSAHFEAEGVDVSFFAAQWFMTLFAYQFPIPLTCRIWDMFLSEGWKSVFKVSIALLQWDEESLLQMRMEEILMELKTVHEGKDPDVLLRRALDVPLRERDLCVFGQDA